MYLATQYDLRVIEVLLRFSGQLNCCSDEEYS